MEELSGESGETPHKSSKMQGRGESFLCGRQCPICGTRTWITNKKRHLDTKKHKEVLYITTERFEMRQ